MMSLNSDMQKLVAHLQEDFAGFGVRYDPAQTLIYKGHKPPGLLILLSGAIKIHCHGDTPKAVSILHGEPILLTAIELIDLPAPCTVTTLETTEALVVPRSVVVGSDEAAQLLASYGLAELRPVCVCVD